MTTKKPIEILLRAAVTVSALLVAALSMAAPRTATLEVENMSCVACAPIVKKVLSRINGVSHVAVLERAGAATVTVLFDDAKVTAEALAQATTNAGFPSSVKNVNNALSTPAGTGVAVR